MSFSIRLICCRLAFALCVSCFWGAPAKAQGANAQDANAQAANAQEALGMPRAGAPRVLRLIGADSKPLSGSFSEPRWETRGVGLFFTRQAAGTRNIWRAFPDPQDSNRYPTWRALPVTQFVAPMFASSPAPIAGDRAILMVSNATNPQRSAQIVRFEIVGPRLRALTDLPLGAFDPAPSPDGATFAFAAQGATTGVYVQNQAGGAARLVARNARRPAWQDNATLLLESVANNGVFRLALGEGRSSSLAVGGQATTSGDGSLLAIIASGASSSASSPSNVSASANANAKLATVYLLAGDGSGLRAVPGTEGARSPALSPDGRTLCFDAPLPGEGATRTLWIAALQREVAAPPEEMLLADALPAAASQEALSLDNSSRRRIVDNPQFRENAQTSTGRAPRPSAPLAQIAGVRRAARGALAVLGVIGGDDVSAFLEVGSGAEPRRWTILPIPAPPTNDAPLLLWTPPAGARGVWSLRLSVSNAAGASQSLLRIRLPLDASIPTPNSTLPNPILPSGGLLPRAPLPNLPAPPALPPLPLPAPIPTAIPAPTRAATAKPAATPLPQVAPVAPTNQLPIPAPFPPVSAVGSPYAPLPRTPNPRAGISVPTPLPTPFPTVTPNASPPPLTAPSKVPRDGVAAGDLDAKDEATFNVSGTLATMSAGQTIQVSFWALNRGGRGWKSGAGAGAVRLVARWVDADRNSRRKWTMQWLKAPVAPGQRTNWSFSLTAPPQPGRYKLIYGLIRLPNDNWQAPAYNAPQQSWPNEFAAIAFAVQVVR